jgi:hypothetical protein
MEQPPHPMRLGDTEQEYYTGTGVPPAHDTVAPEAEHS